MAKKVGKTKIKVGIKGPWEEPEKKGEKPKPKPKKRCPKRIRMLVSCANQHGSFTNGSSYKVPEEVSQKIAWNWINCRYAEEDKSLAGVPEETK